MALEVVNCQYLCEAISKHIYAANSFNNEFAIIDQLSNMMMLNINMFSSRLTFGVFGENDAGLVVSVEYTNIDGVCNSQLIEELSDPHIFSYGMT